MVSELAKGDFEDLQAQGLSPTLEDFDRLNQLALPLKDGAETTCANFPRVGWAGDIPFFQPTLAAFAWYHGYAVRVAKNEETEFTLWAFALAHGRERGAFAALTTADEIEAAVGKWVASLDVTHEEVMRACRYAAVGFDDAQAAEPGNGEQGTGNPRYRADRSEAAKNLSRIEEQLRVACAALKCPPDALMGETQTRLDAICEAAAVELGKTVTKDEARLRAAYDLTLREIVLRLKRESDERKDKNASEHNGGDGLNDDVPLVAGLEPSRRVADGTSGKEPKETVIVVHDDNDTKSDAGGQV